MKGLEIVKQLKNQGWVIKRIRGSHYVMQSPDGKKTIPIPCHNFDLKPGILADIKKITGLK